MTALLNAREELGRDHRTLGAWLEAGKRTRTKELEGAVDVSHGQAEQSAYQCIPRHSVQPANDAIGAPRAISDDDVRAVEAADQAYDLDWIELAVRIGVEHVVEAAGREPGFDTSPVATPHAVVHHSHHRMRARELVGQRSGAVTASVVDDHELETRGDLGQNREQLFGHGDDV